MCKTKRKLRNTTVLPGSGWGSMIRAGNNIRIKDVSWSERVVKSVLISLKCLDNAKAVITLANSAG